MAKRTNVKGLTHEDSIQREFPSLFAAVDFAEGDPPEYKEGGYRASRSGRTSWAGGLTWGEAVEQARHGWPDGADELHEIAEKIEGIVGSRVLVPRVEYDVSGEMVDVGRFLDGEPECMICHGEHYVEGAGRVIHLVAELFVSAGCDTGEIRRRGAAVLALAEVLQATGHTVEVSGLLYSEASGSQRRGGAVSSYLIRLKAPDEVFDVDALSFALVSPSMFRRIVFGMREQETSALRRIHGTGPEAGGYGLPGTPSSAELEGYRADVYVPTAGLGGSHFRTVEGSVSWVLDKLRGLGVELKQGVSA